MSRMSALCVSRRRDGRTSRGRERDVDGKEWDRGAELEHSWMECGILALLSA